MRVSQVSVLRLRCAGSCPAPRADRGPAPATNTTGWLRLVTCRAAVGGAAGGMTAGAATVSTALLWSAAELPIFIYLGRPCHALLRLPDGSGSPNIRQQTFST